MASGEKIGGREDLLEEGRVLFQVLLNDIKREEMTIDALAAHGVAVQFLVAFARDSQKTHTLFALK